MSDDNRIKLIPLAEQIRRARTKAERARVALRLAGLTFAQADRLWDLPIGTTMNALADDEARGVDLARLADYAGVSLGWLVTGRPAVCVAPRGVDKLAPLDADDLLALLGVLR
jgi:hypothetical protein